MVAVVSALLSTGLPLSGQQQSLSSEYIRLGGRVIAIEHPIFVTIAPPGDQPVYPGQTRQLTAAVNGSTNQTVTWQVTSGAGTINAQGLYTAPATITVTSTVTIQATAAADTTKTATTQLSLSPNPAIVLSPSGTTSLYGGQTQQFTATVNIGTVDWSRSPEIGQISTSGLYTPPNPVDSAQTVTVRATSHSNTSIWVEATVQLVPVSITIADPSSSTIVAGSTLQFSATVAGTTNTAATWSMVSGVGSINATTGLYTAPATVSTPQSVTVQATASADTRRTAQKTITVAPSAAQACSLSGSANAANAGGEARVVTVTCTAPAAWGVSIPQGVTWVTATPTSGTGSGSVTLTIAPNIPTPASARNTVITIAEHTYSLNQNWGGTLQINPGTASLTHGQTFQFTALLDGSTPVTGNALWEMTAGSVGTVASGLYTAPATILPSQTTATVKSSYGAYSADLATATVYLQEFAPPSGMAISPTSGSQLSQTFQLSVTDVHGASQINFVHLNFATSITDLTGGCYISVEPGSSVGDVVRVAMQGSGWSAAMPINVAGSTASIENSRCRVFASGSTVSGSGNTLTINLNIGFKPGFIASVNSYMQAYNQQTAYSDWVSVGAWTLTSNVADSAPSLTWELPAAGSTVLGTVNITGYALDNSTQRENKVTSVEYQIDNGSWIAATRTARADACPSAVSDRLDCTQNEAGFTAAWNTTAVSNGSHTVTVRATDGDYTPHTTTGTARTVTVNNPPAPVLSISPSLAYVRQLYNPPATAIEQQQFTAALSGNPPPTDVLWSISAPSPNNPGTISTTGLYTTASYYYANPGVQVTVTGTRSSNPAQTASATVNLVGLMTCGGTPTPVVMASSPNWYCVAAVPLTNYTLTPALGYMDTYGFYHPPSSNSTQQTVILEGRSAYNSSIRYKLQMTLYPY